jgi:hypothetical protein
MCVAQRPGSALARLDWRREIVGEEQVVMPLTSGMPPRFFTVCTCTLQAFLDEYTWQTVNL